MNGSVYKFLFLLVLLSIANLASAQKFKITTATGINKFYHLGTLNDDITDFKSLGQAHFLKLDIENDGIFGNVFVNVEHYGGNVEHNPFRHITCGVGVFFDDEDLAMEHVQKTTFSIGLYPATFAIGSSTKIKLGLEGSYLINSISSRLRGAKYDYLNDTPFNPNLKQKQFLMNGLAEVQLFDFNIGKGIHIQPVYNFVIGGVSEFNDRYKTLSIRHYFGFSVAWE